MGVYRSRSARLVPEPLPSEHSENQAFEAYV